MHMNVYDDTWARGKGMINTHMVWQASDRRTHEQIHEKIDNDPSSHRLKGGGTGPLISSESSAHRTVSAD